MAAYIQPTDYAAFNIADATAAQVNAASLLIDSKLGKPDGLLWSPDGNGNPAWMTAKTATRSYVTASAIAVGLNAVSVNGANFGQGDIGSAVLIDRAGLQPETCIITGLSGNTITVNAQSNHAAGVTLEYGMTLSEDLNVRYGNQFNIVSRPLVAVLGITGSYQGPRNRGGNYGLDALLSIGSGYDSWNAFPRAQVDLDMNTGTALLLPGTVRGGFSRVRVNYIAGWNYANLPYPIKQATANLVRTTIDSEIPANVKMLKAGNATIQNFNSSLFDSDTLNLIMPYRNVRI